jgi:hypothetical protein
VANSYTYNPFGEDFPPERNKTVYNLFKFTGQYFDYETGLYYLRARYKWIPVFTGMTKTIPNIPPSVNLWWTRKLGAFGF